MDIVLGISMEPTAVRLVLIEGENADGLTVEEDNFDLSPPDRPEGQVIAALIGTREGAADGGYQLTSTGVTWTDPTGVAALRDALAACDAGSVMLVSPLLAAAALAQTVGVALGYGHIAMLFVEAGSATLAVVDVADGSIVDLHRQPFAGAHELANMVAGLDAPGSRSDGVFVIGCGVDIVGIKPVLEAATSLAVSGPEEPHLALARGAALASANAPLFASSTAALAYALDPGTGEVNPRALTPTYLDVSANADLGAGALAYSALDPDDQADEDHASRRPRRPLVLTGGAMAGISAIAAGVLVVSLTSDVRPTAVAQPDPRESVLTPATQAPTTEAQFPISSLLPPPTSVPAAPAAEVLVPPAPPPTVQQPPPRAPANMAPPAQPRRAPTQQAPVQTPVQQAPAPSAPPAAVPPPPPEPTTSPTPIMTMYFHVPFFTIPIPIYPPAPPPPPPEPAPGEPGP